MMLFVNFAITRSKFSNFKPKSISTIVFGVGNLRISIKLREHKRFIEFDLCIRRIVSDVMLKLHEMFVVRGKVVYNK